MTTAWSRAIRRGILPIVLGVVCWIVSIPATEDLDPLLKWVGLLLVVLGLVTIVASARTYAADERVLARRPGSES
jgi:peptidoglycan/LPS O-acetylase OafA/YrhL